jgi:hypothetical protein
LQTINASEKTRNSEVREVCISADGE